MRNNDKDKIYVVVDYKPRWNFAAKFYFVCIMIFLLLFGYIMIYRSIHREEIIENVKNNEQNIVQNKENENK